MKLVNLGSQGYEAEIPGGSEKSCIIPIELSGRPNWRTQ